MVGWNAGYGMWASPRFGCGSSICLRPVPLALTNWVPLETPAKLEPKTNLLTVEFLTDLSGFYTVSLAFAPLDVQLEECLLGHYLFKGPWKDRADGLDLDWSVSAMTHPRKRQWLITSPIARDDSGEQARSKPFSGVLKHARSACTRSVCA